MDSTSDEAREAKLLRELLQAGLVIVQELAVDIPAELEGDVKAWVEAVSALGPVHTEEGHCASAESSLSGRIMLWPAASSE